MLAVATRSTLRDFLIDKVHVMLTIQAPTISRPSLWQITMTKTSKSSGRLFTFSPILEVRYHGFCGRRAATAHDASTASLGSQISIMPSNW